MDEDELCLLLVDSDPHILSALKRLFRRKKISVLSCQEISAAFDLLERYPVGVIIADQHFAGNSEEDFFMQVSQQYPQILRIALTGFTDIDFITHMVNTGNIYKLIFKPWDDLHLLEIVDNAFKYYQLQKQNDSLRLQLEETNRQLKKANEKYEKQNALLTTEAFIRQNSLSFAQEILCHLPIAVIGVDCDYMIAFINHAAKQLVKDKLIQLGDDFNVLPEVFRHCMQIFLKNGISQQAIDYEQKTYAVNIWKLKQTGNIKGYIFTLNGSSNGQAQ